MGDLPPRSGWLSDSMSQRGGIVLVLVVGTAFICSARPTESLPIDTQPATKWSGNWSSSWGSEVTSIVVLGQTHSSSMADALKVLAFNRIQPWSPATGIANATRIELWFKGVGLLQGKLLETGELLWENGSRWYKHGSPAAKAAAGTPVVPNGGDHASARLPRLWPSPSPSPAPEEEDAFGT